MEILMILDIIIFALITISFICFFKSKKIAKKIIVENETLSRNLRTANLTIQTLEEQLKNEKSENNKLTFENEHLYEQLKVYQQKVELLEDIKMNVEKAQVEEPKKTRKKSTEKEETKKTTTKKTTKKTTSKKDEKKKGEDK